jgi:DNA polymerase (family 10)
VRNLEIAQVFSDIADLLEIQGANPFRIRAYRRAAQNLESLAEDVAAIAARGDLQEIPGIGKDLAAKIQEYLERNTLRALDELKETIPAGLIQLVKVQGVGPKKAKLFHDSLGVLDLEGLERAAREERLRALPGMGAKSEAKIVRGIALFREGGARMYLWNAMLLAEGVIAALDGMDGLQRIESAGSLRRRRDTVGDLDFLAIASKPEAVMDAFVGMEEIREVLGRGHTKSSVLNAQGFQMDLRVVPSESYGAALAYFTGSKAHNIRLREMAVRRKIRLNEYGYFREPDGQRLGGESESQLYELLDMAFVPAELREDRGEVEAAVEGRLPALIDPGDILGDLHVHSHYSDGAHSIAEVGRAAEARGYRYLAVTDHSPSLGIAHGVSADDLAKKREEIEAWNRGGSSVRLLCGTEVDIRVDGTLDYPDDILASLDVVVASIHSSFSRSRHEQTERVIRAMQHPHVHIIGHLTGRLIGQREGIDIDVEALVREAARTGTVLEINAQPQRMEITDIVCRMVRDAGAKAAIATDAHVMQNLDLMALGVAVARRGWLSKADVLNCMPLEELLAYLQNKKSHTFGQ